MNTHGRNAPATVISIVLLFAALLIATLIPAAMVDCMNPGGIMGLASVAAGPASPALPA